LAASEVVSAIGLHNLQLTHPSRGRGMPLFEPMAAHFGFFALPRTGASSA
jgi:hypothetical protein